MLPALRQLAELPKRMAKKFGHVPSIGLFVGSDSVNLVQMEEAPDYPRIRALASAPIRDARQMLQDDPKAFRQLLNSLLRQQPFVGRRVVTALASGEVKISMVSYRRQKGVSDEAALVAELRERMQGDLDDNLIDYIAVRHSDPQVELGEALVAVAPRQRVTRFLQSLSDVGLEVSALDVGPNALSRLVHHVGAKSWQEYPSLPNALLINVGENSSYLTVIWGRRLILDRAIEFSEARLLTRMANVLGMAPDLAREVLHQLGGPTPMDARTRDAVQEVLHAEVQGLQQEINKTLVYMASKTRGKSVDVLHLAGRASRYPGLLDDLQATLGIKVLTINPITLFPDRGRRAALDPSLGVRAGVVLATGLALREIPEHGVWT